MAIEIRVETVTEFTFYDFSDALRNLLVRYDKGLVTEREIAGFIIQMFHQIPEELYNDIIDSV